MTERIPSSIYNELVDSIWCLQKAVMAQYFSIAPVPSVVRYETGYDDGWLELSAEFAKEDEHLIDTPPRVMSMAFGEVVDYDKNPDFKVWTYQDIKLVPSKKQRTFTKGIQIYSESDNACIFPETHRLPKGQNRKLGSLAWREIATNADLEVFGIDQAREFIQAATRLTVLTRADD